MTKFAFNDPVIIRKSYPVADLRGREGRIQGWEDSGDPAIYNVFIPALGMAKHVAREDDLSLLAEAHPYNYPLPTHMEIIRKPDVVRSDGKEINVTDDSPRFDTPFIVTTSDDFPLPELVGKTGRIVGRYLQTDSWHVVIDGERHVLPRHNLAFVTPESDTARQTPHLRVVQRIDEASAPQFFRAGNMVVDIKDGNLIIEGETYIAASKVIKVAEKYGRRHDWCDVIETEVYPELGIVPPPPRMVTFKVTVPEAVLLEDVDSDTQDYTRWDQVALLAELAGTITLLDERRQLDQAEIEIVSAGNDGPEN